jgi:hypothetical protein
VARFRITPALGKSSNTLRARSKSSRRDTQRFVGYQHRRQVDEHNGASPKTYNVFNESLELTRPDQLGREISANQTAGDGKVLWTDREKDVGRRRFAHEVAEELTGRPHSEISTYARIPHVQIDQKYTARRVARHIECEIDRRDRFTVARARTSDGNARQAIAADRMQQAGADDAVSSCRALIRRERRAWQHNPVRNRDSVIAFNRGERRSRLRGCIDRSRLFPDRRPPSRRLGGFRTARRSHRARLSQFFQCFLYDHIIRQRAARPAKAIFSKIP